MPNKLPHKRKRPANLHSKLLEIRLRLGDSQNGMLRRLGLDDEFKREYVSKWERGLLEPPLHVLLAYSDAANIFLEVLVRDILELPLKTPSKVKSIGLKIESDKNLLKNS